jgi:NitT/TauT family transport system ATP-binding protein
MNWEIRDLTFGYPNLPLFYNFSLKMGEENPLVILGPSGCGKTTLLRRIASLPPFSVPVQPSLPTFSFVFQEPRLLPWRTVEENVAIPLIAPLGKDGAYERARTYLSLVGLEGREHSYPPGLSGGQRQRVSIARAFAFPSQGVLLDEPFQSLDVPLRIQLMDLVLMLLKRDHRSAVMVTHDPREAIYMAQRIVVFSAPPVRILMDERVCLDPSERAYSSKTSAELEARLFAALSSSA